MHYNKYIFSAEATILTPKLQAVTSKAVNYLEPKKSRSPPPPLPAPRNNLRGTLSFSCSSLREATRLRPPATAAW